MFCLTCKLSPSSCRHPDFFFSSAGSAGVTTRRWRRRCLGRSSGCCSSSASCWTWSRRTCTRRCWGWRGERSAAKRPGGGRRERRPGPRPGPGLGLRPGPELSTGRHREDERLEMKNLQLFSVSSGAFKDALKPKYWQVHVRRKIKSWLEPTWTPCDVNATGLISAGTLKTQRLLHRLFCRYKINMLFLVFLYQNSLVCLPRGRVH